MKSYFIDFEKNEITVTRRFFEEAARDIDSTAHKKMLELRSLGMAIKAESRKVRKGVACLSYEKMRYYIECLVDAETYMDEFEAVRKVSRGQKNPYRYVLYWFENRFPNHASLPEFDDQLHLINTPDGYDRRAS